METIKVHLDWEDNYGAASDSIIGCVATHTTLEGVKLGYVSAVEFHLKGLRKDGDEIPVVLQSKFEFVFELTTRALLHHIDM